MLEGIGDEFVTVEAASDGDGRGRLGVLMDDIRGLLSGSNADGVMHIVPVEVPEEDGGRCDPSDAGPVDERVQDGAKDLTPAPGGVDAGEDLAAQLVGVVALETASQSVREELGAKLPSRAVRLRGEGRGALGVV